MNSIAVVGNSLWEFLKKLQFDTQHYDIKAFPAENWLDQVRNSASAPNLFLVAEELITDSGLKLLAQLKRQFNSKLVIVSQNPNIARAVEFIRAGASDYIAWPLDQNSINQVLSHLQANKERAQFFSQNCPHPVPFAGRSPGIVRTLDMLRTVGRSSCNPVLISGETGTGKEMAAQIVHFWRNKTLDNFVAVNCATLTANLLESELFGHVKGAFTGADRDKTGLFEIARNGTIFLDEISEMPLELQAKLLRVLQEKKFRKVGGVVDIDCQALVVASSNRKLMEEINKGTFRRDLYYRLAVFPVKIPSLADPSRRSDIELLSNFFLQNSGAENPKTLTKNALSRLMVHSWPGNVRELKNVIERAIMLEPSDKIEVSSLIFDEYEHFDHQYSSQAQTSSITVTDEDFSLETAEREFIIRALKEANWQRTRAASLLGITRATLHAKLKRYSIKAPAGGRDLDETPQEHQYIGK